MWMPSQVRRAIFKAFFEAGVLVVSSNQSGTHEELNCLNIYPFQIGRSFVSKGFATKQYAWSHVYYTLTTKGIEYLRGYFGLPANAMPKTLEPRGKDEILNPARSGERSFRRPAGDRPRRDLGDRPRRGGFRGRRQEAPAETPAE